MPINGAVLKTGATSMSVTGGTDITFTENGVDIPNGVSVADASATDLRIQKQIIISRRAPSYNATTGEWTKEKIYVTVKKPKILASGKMSFDVARFTREVHPENTAAEKLELSLLTAQVMTDGDFAGLFSTGSLT